MKQISILGCGWLGLPLAKALRHKGYAIKGSTTSENKKEILESFGISHFAIALETDHTSENLPEFLKGSDILIIAIPPKLRGKNKDYSTASSNSFVKKIENLVPLIENATIDKVLFISSTAVYGDANTTISEDSAIAPVTESGKQLAQIEDIIMQNPAFKTTVLRFGGLIGPDRNPARFLAGKENVENPKAPVNLIHLDDCIGIIEKIIELDHWNTYFNAVSPYHPTREDYYIQKALEQNLVPPTFNHDIPSVGKTITSDKVLTQLHYTFSQRNL
ncbi:NAD-dependent epimerase/dehydratase family protein [Flavobacterium sp. UMI-01]|uniref:NAD-dependent epimerase/dehydratase family protein n=1 Tax=Flavobacterium sp. UMI-01 TaxID=1441053 RepID=UPI001C7DA386|nr:NAD-dependent epimerase/dehydratase family protein [Flavobacterium sp. UMI-01]GIZ07965.1 epimerase [Flavobacterium sp. UMI-01]